LRVFAFALPGGTNARSILMEVRSKKEIAREIEMTRRQLDRAIRDTGSTLPGRNRLPTWNITKETCRMLSHRVSDGAHKADEVIHAKPYAALGIAIVAGLLSAVLIIPRRRKARRARRC
jgi:ElaB/YqjD/DUF883 family membrane-anchored ribosome-binding protein